MGHHISKNLCDFLQDTSNESTVHKIFSSYDKNKNGELEIGEFKLFVGHLLKILDQAEKERNKEDLSKSSKNLQIETKLAKHLRILGTVTSFREFKNFDTNNDGIISYAEFLSYVKKIGDENNCFL